MVKNDKKQAPKKFEILFPIMAPEKKSPGDATITHVCVDVYYNKDRVNYFHGQSSARGVYCSVGPIKIENRKCEDGTSYEIRGFGLGSAKAFLLSAEERLNRKHVEEQFKLIKAALRSKTGHVWDLMTRVLAEHRLMLPEKDLIERLNS